MFQATSLIKEYGGHTSLNEPNPATVNDKVLYADYVITLSNIDILKNEM